MTDEIRITRDDLADDIMGWLRIARQKQPGLLRNLAAPKDERGYPDIARETFALHAFAEFLAEKFMVSGKRIVRDRGRAPTGSMEQTAEEQGLTPRQAARRVAQDHEAEPDEAC